MEILNDLVDDGWIAYLNSNSAVSIFHHPQWTRLIVDSYGYRPFVFVQKDSLGSICAGIPVMEVNSPLTGRRWVSLPFSDHCQPLFSTGSMLAELTKEITKFSCFRKITNLDLRGEYSESALLRSKPNFVIHEITLDEDPGIVMGKMHEMHRRNIKVALQKDVQILRGQDLNFLWEFYKLHVQTRHRQGIPVQPWKFFREIYEKMLTSNLGFILLAFVEKKCVAGAVFLLWKETLTYKYGASSDEGLAYRPNNLVMWKAIEWGCLNGLKKMDLGRTSLDNVGLRTYKSRWGAREYPLVYTGLVSTKNFKNQHLLMNWVNGIVKCSPLWVCRFTGELLYKHFG